MRTLTAFLALLCLSIAGVPASAQQAPERVTPQPIYRITINVVEKSTKAINYQHRTGATKIDFVGTPLLPKAHGEAKVEAKQGYIEIEVEFRNLQPANRFGPEFLTYVMWTITPEGRTANIGEVILNGTSSKLNVTTELQAFGLVVTAEPYFGVTQPSDAVVMENMVRADTKGGVQEIEANYQLLQRGQYTANVLPADLTAIALDKKTPLDLYQARNAVRIARWAGAATSAPDSFTKATVLLDQAEAYQARNAERKSVAMTSRQAVQAAEDARLITLKSQADARLAKERAASAAREADASANAADARATAADARADANAADRATDAANALATRTAASAADAAARAAADARTLAERTRLDTERAAQRAASEKQELRNTLTAQLNALLQTRDSARGLIVNMSDVLFDTGQFSLKSGAREKLSKISGIVASYPGLRFEVEGHTDNVGSDERNMTLSENRAKAVLDYLVREGIAASMIGSVGIGESRPVATNDTAAGRQQNRRVELIVSGDAIGTMALAR